MLKTILITSTILSLLLTPIKSLADDCSQVVKDCNAALEKADKVIESQKKEIDLYSKALDDSRKDVIRLEGDLQAANDKNSSLLRNPWFDGLLGAVTAAIILSAVHK